MKPAASAAPTNDLVWQNYQTESRHLAVEGPKHDVLGTRDEERWFKAAVGSGVTALGLGSGLALASAHGVGGGALAVPITLMVASICKCVNDCTSLVEASKTRQTNKRIITNAKQAWEAHEQLLSTGTAPSHHGPLGFVSKMHIILQRAAAQQALARSTLPYEGLIPEETWSDPIPAPRGPVTTRAMAVKHNEVSYPVGFATVLGRRRMQQDAYMAASQPTAAMVGVFDGHGDGGERMSAAARDAAPRLINYHLARLPEQDHDDPEANRHALKNAFEARLSSPRRTIDAHLRATCRTGGSTALLALVRGSNLYVANLGDCRAVLIRPNGDALRLSFDQKPDEPRERSKIEARGGWLVKRDGCARVNNQLAMARALGDWQLPIKRRPQISRMDLSSLQGCTLALCSDGVFDTLADHEVGHLVAAQRRDEQPLPHIAQHVVQAAYHRKSGDNATVGLIAF